MKPTYVEEKTEIADRKTRTANRPVQPGCPQSEEHGAGLHGDSADQRIPGEPGANLGGSRRETR